MKTAAPESVLLRRAAQGDKTAVASLYRTHFAEIERRCRRITGCPHDAADAAQDALLATFRRLPQLDTDTLSFGAYASAAATNRALELRRRAARREVATGDETWLDALAGATPSHDVEVERKEERDAVRAALRAVPERQRIALFRSVYEGRSCQAIADELELTANGVAQLLWRARKSLTDALSSRPGAMLV